MRYKISMRTSQHRNQFATAIDFDSSALKPLIQTNVKIDASKNMPAEQAQILENEITEQEQHWFYSVQKLDYYSAALSAVCFIVSLGFWILGNNQPRVAVQRTTWLVSQHKNLQDSMVLHAKHVNNFCPNAEIQQYLYNPWNGSTDQVITPELRETVVGSKVAVHVGVWNIWWLLLWVYASASACQFTRAQAWDTTYLPYKGPDFARWFEYLLTSPVQVVVVCLAFGFSDLNVLLMMGGATAGLMILGYNIEVTLKKTYRQISKTEQKPKLLGWTVQQYVFFTLAWLLHLLIWGWPRLFEIIPPTWWGIGGLYQLQEDINTKCECNKKADCNLEIPAFVLFIYWSQFAMFTVFGAICTVQFTCATPRAKIDEMRTWYYWTWWYALASITAKTLLEVGFLWFATSDMQFTPIDLKNFDLQWFFALASGETQYATHFDNCIANTSSTTLWANANTVAQHMHTCVH